MYRIIDVLLVAGLMASCTQVPSAPQKAEETEAASLDAAIDSNEDIIPPTNVTGSYLQCIEEENPSDNLQIRCSARDKETDSIIDLNSGFDNYIWSTQTLEAGITISQSTNPSTSEIRFIFEGLPYADAFALMERSQIKLQLFSGADSFFMSDFAISNDRQEVYRDFTIFEIEGSIINNYVEGANALTLPTAFAPYSGLQGCYVACYSVDDTDAVYPMGPDIFVKGQVRVEGRYEANICRPLGDEEADISAIQKYKDYCAEYIPSCASGNCWGGGDTGGWFGLQPAPQ